MSSRVAENQLRCRLHVFVGGRGGRSAALRVAPTRFSARASVMRKHERSLRYAYMSMEAHNDAHSCLPLRLAFGGEDVRRGHAYEPYP